MGFRAYALHSGPLNTLNIRHMSRVASNFVESQRFLSIQGRPSRTVQEIVCACSKVGHVKVGSSTCKHAAAAVVLLLLLLPLLLLLGLLLLLLLLLPLLLLLLLLLLLAAVVIVAVNKRVLARSQKEPCAHI